MWNEYMAQKNGQKEYQNVLDNMGLPRMCCRRMLLSHVDVIDDVAMYSSVCSEMDESRTIFDAYVEKKRSVSCD